MVLRRLISLSMLLALLAGLSPALLQAQQVNFNISSTSITTDDVLTVQVKVSGARQSGTPAYPAIEGFMNVGTSQNMSLVNGRSSSTYSCNYRPQKTGSFTVPSFRIRVDGQDFASPSWKVQVAKGTGKPAQQQGMSQGSMGGQTLEDFFNRAFGMPSQKDLQFEEVKADYFLSVETSKSAAYPGEQLLGEVVMYINEQDYNMGKLRYGIGEVNQMAARVKNSGFWQEMLPSYQITGKRVTVGGKPYVAISLYKTFLYPLEPGTIKFDDVYLDAQKLLVAKNARDIFNRAITDYEPVKVYARKKEVTVKPLPGTRLNHAGIAGVFTMDATLSQDTLQTGEVGELRIVMGGKGHVAMLPEPLLKLPQELDVYDVVSNTESKVTETDVLDTKTFVWTFMPTRPGQHQIGPVTYRFFNPDKEQYDSLVVPAFTLHAFGEDLVNARMKDQENDAFYLGAFEGADRGMRGDVPRWEPWVLLACLLSLAGAGAWTVVQWRRRSKRNPDAEEGQDFKPLPKEDSFWTS